MDIEAVAADAVLRVMEYARNRLNFVILDACRDNPYASSFRSSSRGLARMEAASGVLVAYATAPGRVAADGSGRFSPYTRALSAAMEVAGLSAESMFREVRNDVIRRTNGAQVPWEASSLVGAPFHFNPRQGAATAEASPNPPVAKPAASGTRSGEVVFWQSILGSTNRAVFEEYLHQYPDGQFAGLARIRIGERASPFASGHTRC